MALPLLQQPDRLKARLREVPSEPGCYLLRDADDRILYIGKAKVLRSWGGIMDMTPDGSPIIDKTHIEGLFLDCGWCYGGFKAVPGSGFSLAHLIATGNHHAPAEKFRLDRFRTGRGLMDEEGTGAQHDLH